MKPAILLALCLSLVTRPARAQWDDDSLHHVVWVSAGLGMGSARLQCDTCRGPSSVGTDLMVAIGGVRDAHIRGGLTLDLWEGPQSAVANISFSVFYYPWQSRALFLEGGFGGASLCLGDVTASGVTFGGALGSELPVKPGVYLKPRIAFTYASVSDVADPNGSSTATRPPNWGHGLLTVGLSLEWEHE